VIKSISIVYPMYNEMENITTAVDEALRFGRAVASEVEIVIVDDASSDGSGELVDELAVIHSEVRVIHHPENRKLGGALKTGFAAASKEWVLYMDSDLPIKMDDALRAVPLTDEADLIIGWRMSRAESWQRHVMSWVYNRLVRTMFGLRVIDVNFAFKMFRNSYAKLVPLTSNGSFIDAEFLLGMQALGARRAELGFVYYPRVAGVSTLGSKMVAMKTFFEMVSYRLNRYEKLKRDLGGERGRLRAESGDQSRDRDGMSSRDSAQHQSDAQRTGV